MKKNKTLFLMGKNCDMYRTLKDTNIIFSKIYSDKLSKYLIRIFRNNMYTLPLTLAEWKKNIREYQTIILFDTESTPCLIKWLATHTTKEVRLIFYYRNSIESLKVNRQAIMPDKVKKYGFELWSYNVHDCNKYNMNYNSQVADSSVFQHNKVLDIKYDVFFAGLAKGRIQQLDLIQSIIVQKGLTPYFFIPDKSDSKQSQLLSYDNYLEKIMESRALLDIVTDKNYGLTMRPLEAMFSKRKLITNYDAIKEYEFYHPNNIYIFKNSDCLNKIEEFLESEYIDLDEEINKKYDIEKWVYRFFK